MAQKLTTEKMYSYVYAPRKFQGMKWPGSERTKERIGPAPIGRFAGPGAKRLGTLSTRAAARHFVTSCGAL